MHVAARMDDRFSDRLHRVPDVPHDFRVFDWAPWTHGLRCRSGLADLSGIWEAPGFPSAARCSQVGGTMTLVTADVFMTASSRDQDCLSAVPSRRGRQVSFGSWRETGERPARGSVSSSP